jgi:hypothetical protein
MLGFLRRYIASTLLHMSKLAAYYICHWFVLTCRLVVISAWAPQGLSADLLRPEGIQRRTTKFILRGPVVQKWVNANPRLKFNLLF